MNLSPMSRCYVVRTHRIRLDIVFFVEMAFPLGSLLFLVAELLFIFNLAR